MPESHMRPKSSISLKHEMVRQDIDEKWKRTVMTPTGIKIIRIQPSLNYNSLHKYQYRHDISPSPRSTPPRHSPVPPSRSSSRAVSAKSQPSGSGTPCPAGEVLNKPPAPTSRPGSSRCHSTLFNARTSSCQPTNMYMKDDLRRAAKLNRPVSHVHSCSSSQIEEPKTPRSPRRFDGSVVNLPKFVERNEFLTHEDLSMGQKQYIWGIARIYSMSNLMQLKQRQYQSLLDYDFSRRIQNKELKEHERMKEWREYLRYSKFIKNYEQRIPRAGKQNKASSSPCEEVSHIHRHLVKGWTTNPHSDEGYRSEVNQERLATIGQREKEIEEVRRLPTGQEGDDQPLSGHYRVVVVKTPKSDEVAGKDDQTCTEEKKSRDEQQSRDERLTGVIEDLKQNSDNAEQFCGREEDNFL